MNTQDSIFDIGKQLQVKFDDQLYERFLSTPEPSSLSSGVLQLLRNEQRENIMDDTEYLFDDLTLNWSKFPKRREYVESLGDDLVELDGIHKACLVLSPLIDSLHERISRELLAMDPLSSQVTELTTYLSSSEIIPDMLHLFKSGEYFLCLTMGITFFERAIGDILLSSKKISIEDSEDTVPTNDISFRDLKINEMLRSPDLAAHLGEDVVFLIRCFTGPLQSLNLRNLIWHGFLGMTDFHPSFASFLFVLIFSVGKLPIVRGTSSVRPLRNMELFVIDSKVLSDSDFDKFEIEHVFTALEHSFFIPRNRLMDWKKAVQLYFEGQNYYCLAMVLPLLEHSLRRLFSYINNSPERVCSAETHTLYTTFDEILDPQIELPDSEISSPNLLYNELGNNVVCALFDFLVWKEGPRIRDKLSHGVCAPRKIPKSITQIVMSCCLFLCEKYTVASPCSLRELYPLWYDCYINYEPLYHPSSLLATDMQRCYEAWRDFHTEFIIVGKNTTRIQKEMNEPLKRMVSDTDQCLKTIDHVHEEIVSKYSSHVLFSVDNFNGTTTPVWTQFSCTPQMPKQFTGKIGNCVSVWLNGVYALRRVVTHTNLIMERVKQSYESGMELLQKGKAYARHRKLLANIISNSGDFSQIVQLIMSQVQLLHLEIFNQNRSQQSLNASETMRHNCLAFTACVAGSLQTNKWGKVTRDIDNYILHSHKYDSGSEVCKRLYS